MLDYWIIGVILVRIRICYRNTRLDSIQSHHQAMTCMTYVTYMAYMTRVAEKLLVSSIRYLRIYTV